MTNKDQKEFNKCEFYDKASPNCFVCKNENDCKKFRSGQEQIDVSVCELAKELLQKRLEAGLTQKDLAEKLGIQRTCICMYENGARNPPKLVLNKFEKIMGWTFLYKKLNIYELVEQLKLKEQEFNDLWTKYENEVTELQWANCKLEEETARYREALTCIKNFEWCGDNCDHYQLDDNDCQEFCEYCCQHVVAEIAKRALETNNDDISEKN